MLIGHLLQCLNVRQSEDSHTAFVIFFFLKSITHYTIVSTMCSRKKSNGSLRTNLNTALSEKKKTEKIEHEKTDLFPNLQYAFGY